MSALTTQSLYGINFPATPDDDEFWAFLDESAIMLEADAWALAHAGDELELDEYLTVSLNEATDELRAAGYDLELSACGQFLLARDYLGFCHWLTLEDGQIDAYDLESVYFGS